MEDAAEILVIRKCTTGQAVSISGGEGRRESEGEGEKMRERDSEGQREMKKTEGKDAFFFF